MSATIRELARHIHNKPSTTLSLRQLLDLEGANIHLKIRNAPFSVMTYNMALLVFPATYLGVSSLRAAAINELVTRIKANPPDVVGLCEVFDNEERTFIRARLADVYKHHREGPDEEDIESDGGLLLLSKHPILAAHDTIYRQCAGGDCFANKGVLHIRVQPPDSPMPYDIYYSHTQNIEEAGGKEALYSQLLHLGQMAQGYGDPRWPMLFLGDLNIPGENPQHYKQLIQRLNEPVDLWLVQSDEPGKVPGGFTWASDNNFYADAADVPQTNQRLDYILMKAGLNLVPILKSIEILKWSHNGRQISDHYGLLAHFDQRVEVGVSLTGSISAVRAHIKAYHCIEETDQVGADNVSFTIILQDSHGHSVQNSTTIFEEVVTGAASDVMMESVQLNGDPGNSITVKVMGTEFDDLNANDSLGTSSMTISRTDLLLNLGSSFRRYMPFLTGDGGEYSLLIEVLVD